ncbi:hypothetical protein BVY04_04535 [bacterium M21]|nr:hypothetical protein BVY04_04535 [bacterium M21]
MINKDILNALFAEIHKAIDEASDMVTELNTDLSYPPGIELTSEEKEALSSLQLSEHAKSGLKKLVADASAYPSFHFFSLLDAVTDPDVELEDVWLGASIEPITGDETEDEDLMLHDQFHETYWLYEEGKENG